MLIVMSLLWAGLRRAERLVPP